MHEGYLPGGSNRRIDDQTREKIFRLVSTGELKTVDIARRFGISPKTVNEIKKSAKHTGAAVAK